MNFPEESYSKREVPGGAPTIYVGEKEGMTYFFICPLPCEFALRLSVEPEHSSFLFLAARTNSLKDNLDSLRKKTADGFGNSEEGKGKVRKRIRRGRFTYITGCPAAPDLAASSYHCSGERV